MNIKKSLPKSLNRFSSAIDINSIIRLCGVKNGLVSFWVQLKSKSGTVEGKLHQAINCSNRLIIFEPGFPGDGSTRLENLWLPELLKNDFDVFAVRHNGTIINGEFSNNYLNCKERQLKAEKQKQNVLGDNPPHTINNWLNEPFIALESLFNLYKEFYLIGHSFGGLAVLYSLVNFSEKYRSEAKKIKRLISLAGSTGIIRGDDDPVLNRWREHIDTDAARMRIKIGNVEQNIQFLKNAYNKVHNKIKQSAADIQMLFVYVFGDRKNTVDEFIYPNEPLDILGSLQGKGVLVIDKSERADDETGQLAHDMDNLKSSTLVRFINEEIKDQIVVI